MKKLLEHHFQMIFEMLFLLSLFIIGALFLAWQPDNQQLASWITGGAVVGVIARALHTGSKENKEP